MNMGIENTQIFLKKKMTKNNNNFWILVAIYNNRGCFF